MMAIMGLTKSPFTSLSVGVKIKDEYSPPLDTCLDQKKLQIHVEIMVYMVKKIFAPLFESALQLGSVSRHCYSSAIMARGTSSKR